jgi:glycosyltransferase involved in cell wall biosynthesis
VPVEAALLGLDRGRSTRVPPPWHIVTGEYPPSRGGVADYSRSIARALALAGDEVHVWTPSSRSGLVNDAGVTVHSLEQGFGPRGLVALSRDFDRQRGPRRLLLQYVPQAFGLRGMNVPFCAWIASLRDTQVWVMFHEVMVRWEPPRSTRKAVLVATTHAMAGLLVARADRLLVSIPSWKPLLRSLALRRPQATWLPIPSSLPTDIPSESGPNIRKRLGLEPEIPLMGHFGTYGSLIGPLLKNAALAALRSDPRRRLLLLGRGGEAFARDLTNERAVADRVVATGELESADVAAHLSACDVLVQPYADGVSTRRTSAMAGLALGIPIATNDGRLTESVWRETGAVELAATSDRVDEAAELLLRDRAYAAAVGERGRSLYRRRFSLEHTIRGLQGEDDEATP